MNSFRIVWLTVFVIQARENVYFEQTLWLLKEKLYSSHWCRRCNDRKDPWPLIIRQTISGKLEDFTVVAGGIKWEKILYEFYGSISLEHFTLWFICFYFQVNYFSISMQGEVRENDCNCQNGFKCSAWCENEVSTVAEDGAKRVLKVCSTQIQWQNWLNELWLPIRTSKP